MDKPSAVFALILSFVLPGVAEAYVGPGAGLSLLGALWALLAAVATAVVFVIAWPIRRMRRRRREEQLRRDDAAAAARRTDAEPADASSPARQEAGAAEPPSAGGHRTDSLQRQ